MPEDNKPESKGTPPNDNEQGNNGGDDAEAKKQAELNALAAKVRAEEKRKYDKELETAVQAAKIEAEKLAQMSAEEREAELTKKQSAELEAARRDITVRENKIAAYEKLTALKMDTRLIDHVLDEDPTKMELKIKTLHDIYTEAVKAGISESLKGNPPKDPKGNSEVTTKPIVTTL